MLTAEQINQIRQKSGLQPINNGQSNNQKSGNYAGKFDYLKKDNGNNDNKPSFIDKVKQGAENVVNETANNFQEIGNTYDQNKNIPATLLSSSAIIPKAIGDAIFESIKAILPDNVKEEAKKHFSEVINNPAIKDHIIAPLEKWASENPQTARAVKDVADIASVLPEAKAAELVGKESLKAGETIAKEAVKAGENTGKLVLKGKDSVKNVITKGAEKATDIITPIDKGVETVLTKPTTKIEKLMEYEKAATEALKDYSKMTPLELAGQKAEGALTHIQSSLKSLGEKKKALTETLSKINTGDIVDTARTKMRTLLKDRAGLHYSENGTFRNAPGRLSTVSDSADLKLIQDIDFKLSTLSKNPTFRKVDDTIDWIQDKVFKRKSLTAVPVNEKVNGIIKTVVKDLNDNLKEIGGTEYKALNKSYSGAKKTFDNLNKALGIEGNKGASLMKQLFSPNGTASRKLFEQVKDLTGIDLVDEATLAKFVMENAGDVRQASLLEQVLKGSAPISKKGLIQYAAEHTINKLQNPLGKAKRIILKGK